MAKSVTTIRDEENQEELFRQAQTDKVEAMFADHADELEGVMHVLELLQGKGLIDAAVAVLEQGHDVLDILVKQANKPGSIGGIKSVIAIVQGVTKIDAKLVSAIFGGLGDASQAISGGEADDVSDLWDIVRLMRDPDVATGLTAIFAVLKSVGQHLQSPSAASEQKGPDGVRTASVGT